MKVTVNVKKGTRKLYQEIASTRYFEGGELGTALVFCMAVSIGYKRNKFQKEESTEWVTRREYIDKNFEMRKFIEAVAVAHKQQLEVLSDENMIYEIVESYANGGITELYAMVINRDPNADFDNQIELMIKDVVKENKIEK